MKKVLLLFVAFILAHPSRSQNKTATIDSLVNRTHALGLFNGNVLVVEKGKEIYRKAIGYTDASKAAMLTDQYRFHIGSIAKEFNAVAIMMLREGGKLSLDDKVSRYLPGLPAWASTISIKNLLQYASGLPDLRWRTIKDDAAAMDSLQQVTKLDFEPGTQYAYNNSNTLLQRKIIEQLTGMHFADFVRQKMLQPLKMTASLVDPEETTPLMAKSFNDQLIQSPLWSPIAGWTAVTLDDFYKWEKSLETFRLISPTATKEIITPIFPGKQCGLGGGNMDGDKLASHKHDGTSLNYQALLTANTTKGRTIILMTNNKQNNLGDINLAIKNILDGKPYGQPKKQVANALQLQIEQWGGKEVLAAYNELKRTHPAEYDFESESALNTIGYVLLNKKRYEDAIIIFEYNTRLFPNSGNVFDSLAEAYYTKGDTVNALLYYKRSFALDPTNQIAKERITALQR